MNNRELLANIVKTLHVTNEELAQILKLGNITDEEIIANAFKTCDNETLEGFLNGFIIYKRGPKEEKPGMDKKAPLTIQLKENTNNIIFKKLKIAFSLTNEDIVEIFENGNLRLSKNDLTAYLRKEGHKHYRILEDKYLKVFLKGVAGY